MKMAPILTILPALFVFVHQVSCYPDGQWVDSACTTLTPQHGTPAQTSASPYSITFSPAIYSGGGTVSVTISGSSFKGFMIQARNASSCDSTAIGSFTVVANTRAACSNAALVHSNSNSKSSITFTWNAPSSSAGHIVFRAAVVQSVYVFWTTVQCDVLKDSSLPAITTPIECTPLGKLDDSSVSVRPGMSGAFSLLVAFLYYAVY